MRIIISPAKKMNVDPDSMAWQDLPHFYEDADRIRKWIRTLTPAEARILWGCSEKLAAVNYRRFQEMDLHSNLTPAILSYEGIQYQYMAPMAFTGRAWEYVQQNLRILSGFYGVLRPLDGVTPYRLEMQADLTLGGSGTPALQVRKSDVKRDGKSQFPLYGNSDMDGPKNLYEFWGDRLYREILDESRVIINLASKEYSRCIEAYVRPEDRFITCVFGEWKKGKVIQKATYAKMARGEMARFMAENQISSPEGMKEFHGLGYAYAPELSSENEYVFISSFDRRNTGEKTNNGK